MTNQINTSYLQGMRLYRESRYEEAIPFFNKAIKFYFDIGWGIKDVQNINIIRLDCYAQLRKLKACG